MNVFTGGACALEAVSDRSILILVQNGDEDIFKGTYVMNFSSSDNADCQINKNHNRDLVFSVFGHSYTSIAIHGFQASLTYISGKDGKSLAETKTGEDIESIYRRLCIASESRALLKIITGNSGIVTNGSVYQGYMVGFEKKPMGEDKINGYAFTINIACEKAPEDSPENDGTDPDGISDRGNPKNDSPSIGADSDAANTKITPKRVN